MQELIVEIAIYLGLAALLGFLLAYLIWGFGQRRRIESARASAAAAVRTSVDGDSPLRTQIEGLTRERDRLEHRVEVLSAQVASMMENQGAAEPEEDVERALGTVRLRTEEDEGDALEAAAASFPRIAEPEEPDRSIFLADEDEVSPPEAPAEDLSPSDEAPADEDDSPSQPVPAPPARRLFQRRSAPTSASASVSDDVDPKAGADDEESGTVLAVEDAATEAAGVDETSQPPDADDSDAVAGADDAQSEDEMAVGGSDDAAEASDASDADADDEASAETTDDSTSSDEAESDRPNALRDAADTLRSGLSESPAAAFEFDGEDAGRPSFILDAEPVDPDDLTRIKGIGKATEKALNANGVWHFRQIAQMSDEDRAWVRTAIGGIPGRMTRDRWVEQARDLMREKATPET